MVERDESQPWPGSPPHPERAYVKALLVKKWEKFEYVTDLRRFLVKHPLLILEISIYKLGLCAFSVPSPEVARFQKL